MNDSYNLKLVAERSDGLEEARIVEAVSEFLERSGPLRRVLLIPPDITRFHSGAGLLAGILYKALVQDGVQVRVLPAVGTHEPMSRAEIEMMYPDVPADCFFEHNWRDRVRELGVVPEEFMAENSDGWVRESLSVEVSSYLFEDWDLIVSIGQVVPHEVAGMANYTKNIVIGCGGKKMIDHSHMLSAIYGIEKTLGEVDNPVRKLLDYCQDNLLNRLPLTYFLTVTDEFDNRTRIQGLFVGGNRRVFEDAAGLSGKLNIHWLDRKLSRVVVNLDSKKFKSTWLGNKAIYRTRMALDDNAELIVLAGGIGKFGEDPGCDELIRKYGYRGREEVLSLVDENEDLKRNLSVAAHLIHGSSDGRFSVIYAVDQSLLSREEIEGIGYNHMNYEDALDLYRPEKLKEGLNAPGSSEEFYYVSNPALALWRTGGSKS